MWERTWLEPTGERRATEAACLLVVWDRTWPACGRWPSSMHLCLASPRACLTADITATTVWTSWWNILGLTQRPLECFRGGGGTHKYRNGVWLYYTVCKYELHSINTLLIIIQACCHCHETCSWDINCTAIIRKYPLYFGQFIPTVLCCILRYTIFIYCYWYMWTWTTKPVIRVIFLKLRFLHLKAE